MPLPIGSKCYTYSIVVMSTTDFSAVYFKELQSLTQFITTEPDSVHHVLGQESHSCSFVSQGVTARQINRYLL